MKSLGSRFCRQCGNLFPLTDRGVLLCDTCLAPASAPEPPPAPAPAPAAHPRGAHVTRPRPAPRPKTSGAGTNAGPVAGPRTLPMLRALAAAPGGLTTPQLAAHASEAASWVNALGSTRQLMLKQERLGRVRQAGTVASANRTRPSVLWRITAEGEQYVADAAR